VLGCRGCERGGEIYDADEAPGLRWNDYGAINNRRHGGRGVRASSLEASGVIRLSLRPRLRRNGCSPIVDLVLGRIPTIGVPGAAHAAERPASRAWLSMRLFTCYRASTIRCAGWTFAQLFRDGVGPELELMPLAAGVSKGQDANLRTAYYPALGGISYQMMFPQLIGRYRRHDGNVTRNLPE